MLFKKTTAKPVSYTHLDVYKRQQFARASFCLFKMEEALFTLLAISDSSPLI